MSQRALDNHFPEELEPHRESNRARFDCLCHMTRRMTSLERSNVSVVTSMRRLQKSLDALATKEGVRRASICEVGPETRSQSLSGM